MTKKWVVECYNRFQYINNCITNHFGRLKNYLSKTLSGKEKKELKLNKNREKFA